MSGPHFSPTSGPRLKECPRRHYYDKYAANWKGDDQAKAMYKLKKATNRFGFLGDVVHQLAQECIDDHDMSIDDAYGYMIERGRSLLREGIDESRREVWRKRKAVRLLEHERGENLDVARLFRDLTTHVRGLTSPDAAWSCGANLLFRAMNNRDRVIQCEQLIEWDGLSLPTWLAMDLLIEGPDGAGVIVDWKTGRPKGDHQDQLSTYAAYVYSLGFEKVRCVLVYTGHGPKVVQWSPTEDEARSTAEWMASGFAEELAGYLAGADMQRNEPKPEDCWPATGKGCRWCNFRDVCPRGKNDES